MSADDIASTSPAPHPPEEFELRQCHQGLSRIASGEQMIRRIVAGRDPLQDEAERGREPDSALRGGRTGRCHAATVQHLERVVGVS
jgi:hypothetical protein